MTYKRAKSLYNLCESKGFSTVGYYAYMLGWLTSDEAEAVFNRLQAADEQAYKSMVEGIFSGTTMRASLAKQQIARERI